MGYTPPLRACCLPHPNLHGYDRVNVVLCRDSGWGLSVQLYAGGYGVCLRHTLSLFGGPVSVCVCCILLMVRSLRSAPARLAELSMSLWTQCLVGCRWHGHVRDSKQQHHWQQPERRAGAGWCRLQHGGLQGTGQCRVWPAITGEPALRRSDS